MNFLEAWPNINSGNTNARLASHVLVLVYENAVPVVDVNVAMLTIDQE